MTAGVPLRAWTSALAVLLAAVPLVAQTAPQDSVALRLARGRQIFEGKGLCFSCHGKNGEGILAPGTRLAGRAFTDTRETLADVVALIKNGVDSAHSVSHQAMPPRGGSRITDAEVELVAAYVLELRKKTVGNVVPPRPVEWTMIKPVNARRTGYTSDPRLSEASGAAVSRANPGLIWTINDSDNPPDLLAIDTTGRLRASIRLVGTTNVDWEEVALGPCGAERCVYVADTGDNDERRPEVALYRTVEPIVPAPAAGDSVTFEQDRNVETLRLRYPDGSHDVEAMVITPAGDALLVTKGRSRGVLVFRVRAAAWREPGPVTAERIDSLPITAVMGMGRLVTGMALAPDGKWVIVRTYRDLYPFALHPDDTFRPMGRPTACDILGYEPQGEGVDFLDPRRLILTSERGLFPAGTVWILECPVPDSQRQN